MMTEINSDLVLHLEKGSLKYIEDALAELKITINGVNFMLHGVQNQLEFTVSQLDIISNKINQVELNNEKLQNRLSDLEKLENVRATKNDMLHKIFGSWLVWVVIIGVLGALDYGHLINLIKSFK
jgi:hypothetical protein